MPWKKLNDVPPQVRTHKKVKLTLAQANWVANIADSTNWAIAWKKFTDRYHIEDNKWVRRSETMSNIDKARDYFADIISDDKPETNVSEENIRAPYENISELPSYTQKCMPEDAQKIYMAAYNDGFIITHGDTYLADGYAKVQLMSMGWVHSDENSSVSYPVSQWIRTEILEPDENAIKERIIYDALGFKPVDKKVSDVSYPEGEYNFVVFQHGDHRDIFVERHECLQSWRLVKGKKAVPQPNQDKKWLACGNLVVVLPDSREMLELYDKGRVHYGIETDDIREMFFEGNVVKGKYIFTKDPDGVWSVDFKNEESPLVLDADIIPPFGFSCLPEHLRKAVPNDYTYWTEEDNDKRRELLEKYRMYRNIMASLDHMNVGDSESLETELENRENLTEELELDISGIAHREGTYNHVHYSPKELESAHKGLVGKPMYLNHRKERKDPIGKVLSTTWNASDNTTRFKARVNDDNTEDRIQNRELDSVSVGVLVDYYVTWVDNGEQMEKKFDNKIQAIMFVMTNRGKKCRLEGRNLNYRELTSTDNPACPSCKLDY